jgi:hypothetical protein
MSIEMGGMTTGNMVWNTLNTLLAAGGVATGSTALGSKTSTEKVKEIIREELGGCGCGYNRNGYGFHNSCENPLVNRFELLQNQEISRLQAKEYSDMSDLKLFDDYTTKMNAEKDRVNGRFEIVFNELVASRERLQAEVCKLDKEVALNKQAMEFGFANTNREFASINGRLDAITKEVVPLSALCPQPLPACVPVGFQGQVITTTDTTASNTVVGVSRVASK